MSAIVPTMAVRSPERLRELKIYPGPFSDDPADYDTTVGAYVDVVGFVMRGNDLFAVIIRPGTADEFRMIPTWMLEMPLMLEMP